MTIQELQEKYQFNKETPIVIGDRCKVYFGKLNNEDEVIIISDLSPRIIKEEPVDSYEVGATLSFDEDKVPDNPDTFVFGSVQYTIRMLENYTSNVIDVVHKIIEEIDENNLRALEIQLLHELRLPELDRTQKLLDIKNLYKQGLYDETFKAIAYDYADDILLDGDMLYLLGDMCEKGMGTFQNKEQALQFFTRAAEVGVTNAGKRAEMIQQELDDLKVTAAKKESQPEESASEKINPTDTSRLKRKSGGPVNRKRGLSKKNKIRYSIIGSFSFILGAIFSSFVILAIGGDNSSQEPIATDDVTNENKDEVTVNPSDAIFESIESDVLKNMRDLQNFGVAQKKLNDAIKLIDQGQEVNTFTPGQTKRLDQLKGYIMGQISDMKDNEKGNFTIKYIPKSTESVVAIANRYKIPEKNVIDQKGKSIPIDYTFKDGEEVKLRIPSYFFNHKILPGESIGTIANKYDIQTEDIKKLSELSSDVLQPGQTLRVYIRQ
ncbi:LysM peptidoglycan-binding domain-containing protein [Flammeovirga sp. SubArs3]|uniref:LysM peptidoglycan-binding domain-containing protein n=1 Tax=Flammeovirga sp. SubArs3 TaxID=2995316 RepID=UPI00248B19F6|nr:LysM peptidoglycan-binding domain-containing protein [Flammeovirga sp. SubArs3]